MFGEEDRVDGVEKGGESFDAEALGATKTGDVLRETTAWS